MHQSTACLPKKAPHLFWDIWAAVAVAIVKVWATRRTDVLHQWPTSVSPVPPILSSSGPLVSR